MPTGPALVAAAVEIALDGDQITRHCYGCGARVRSFDWHAADGLPIRYVGRTHPDGRFGAVYALYATGAVRAVPAVADVGDGSTGISWPCTFTPDQLTRAVLAHLTGLDVLPHLTGVDDAGVASAQSLVIADGGESRDWSLDVDDLTAWLEAHR